MSDKQKEQQDLDNLLSGAENNNTNNNSSSPEPELRRSNSTTSSAVVSNQQQNQKHQHFANHPPAQQQQKNTNKNNSNTLSEPLMNNQPQNQYQTIEPASPNHHNQNDTDGASDVSQRELLSRGNFTPNNNNNNNTSATSSVSRNNNVSNGPSFAKRLVLAIVNPLSGERSAAEGLCRSLTTILGEDRILKLSVTVFRDPNPIKHKIAEGIRNVLAANNDAQEMFDGSEPHKRMSVLVAGGDGTVSFIIGVLEGLVKDPNSGLNGVAPAIMVIPMGTGNDLSNAMGCGLGFQTNKLCCCCCCCPNDVEQIMRTGLSAPIIPFDRWNCTLYRVDNKSANGLARIASSKHTNTATIIQEKLARVHDQHSLLGAANTAASGCYDTTEEWKEKLERSTTADTQANAAAGEDDINLTPLASYDFNNYFSFGLDAAIATDFDDKRKKFPSCHTYRTMNKMWYGYHGIAMAVSATPFTNGIVNISCDKNEVALSSSQNNCRAFVISNINSYSGGVDLWGVKKPVSEKQTAAATGATRDVTYSPTSFSDGMLEAVSLGGFFHMGFMRIGMGGDKVAQGSRMTFALGDFIGKNELRGKTLAFQVDGEPAGEFTYDPGCLVVDVKLHTRVYFHKVGN